MPSTVLITVTNPVGSEPKIYRKRVDSDDELFALIDRAVAKYGTPPDPGEPLRYARAKAIAGGKP